MSKGLGRKIVVKFSEDITGGVESSKDAFKIFGQEPQYDGGPLIDRDYEIAKIEQVALIGDILPEYVLPFGGDGSVVSELDISLKGTPRAHSTFGASWSVENAFNYSCSGNPWYASGTVDRWIGVDYGVDAYVITRFSVCIGDNRWKGFVFEATNDGGFSWTQLLVGEFAQLGTTLQTFNVPNASEYRYYRLRCTSVWTGSNVSTHQFILYAEVAELGYMPSYEFIESRMLDDAGIVFSNISWQEENPEGTDIKVYTSLDGTGWSIQENDDSIACLSGVQVLSDTTLHIKIELSTDNVEVTPSISDLSYTIFTSEDAKHITITLEDTDRIHNTIGEVEVSYDATIGNLMGRGGMVEAFDVKFTPTDLVPKRNPIIAEHITVGASAEVAFTEVAYNRGYEEEHITVSATATVDFIHVGVVNP